MGVAPFWFGVEYVQQNARLFNQGTLNALRYRDDILAPNVRPFARAVGDNFISMQDKARPRTARLVMHYLNQEGIEIMDCPARSPDLNSIKHVWDYIYRRISQRQNRPITLPDLTQALILECNELFQEMIATLIRSMPSRCREFCDRRGGIHITSRHYLGLFDLNNEQFKSLSLLVQFFFSCS